VHRLAVISGRGTGASIADVVSEAVIVAVQGGHDVVTYADVVKARHLKTHGPPDDFSYTDWENHAVAVHEACHAVAMYRLKKREVIDVATIERRGGVGGFVSPVPLEEEMFDWRTGLENDVMTFLASLAGERLFFDGDNSVGVGGDLRSSTAILIQMHGFAGMGENVASMGSTLGIVGRQPSAIIEDGTDRQFLETAFGRQIDARLHELLDRVAALLADDREHVLAVAHALETHKTITGEDVVAIVEGTMGVLVDGARYHDPVARAELMTYHAAVLRAMKEHGRVAHPLPVVSPPPVPPVPIPTAELPPPVPPPPGPPVPPTNGGGVAYPPHPPVVPGEGTPEPPR
jgi:ATP-dependent Zn protease